MKKITHSTVAVLVMIVVAGIGALAVHAQEEAETATSTNATTTVPSGEVGESDDSDVAGVERTRIETIDPVDDFIVSPGKTEVVLAPGESVTKYVTVTSRIAESTSFTVYAEDLVGSDDPNQSVQLLGDQRGPYSLQDYIEPAVDEFALELGERVRIPVEVSVPDDAEPGGHYGAVMISTTPGEGGQLTTISRIGVIFLVRVEGPVNESGHVEDFRIGGTTGLIYTDGGPFTFEVLFENTGSVHLVPYGTVTVSNTFGKTVGLVPVDAYFALPEALRYRQVEWDPERFLVGRYSATLELNLGYGNETEVREIHFWVIPWKVLAGVFFGILFLILLVRFVASRFEIRRRGGGEGGKRGSGQEL